MEAARLRRDRPGGGCKASRVEILIAGAAALGRDTHGAALVFGEVRRELRGDGLSVGVSDSGPGLTRPLELLVALQALEALEARSFAKGGDASAVVRSTALRSCATTTLN